MMKALTLAARSLLLIGLSAGAAYAENNVALNAQVELWGGDFGDVGAWGGGPAADASTLTDGQFLPENQQWNVDTVFWSGQRGADLLKIFLPAPALVTQLVLQADNNDSYLIRYRGTDNAWHDLSTVYSSGAWGMHATSVTLDAPVEATAFSIQGDGGDGHYAVSEFQVFDAPVDLPLPAPQPVPEPASWAMLAAGLLPLFRRRPAHDRS